jgi:type I restriction enzyme R subunit
MKPEEQARLKIDTLLTAAGWAVQDMSVFNLRAAQGVAIREFSMKNGVTDYLLFIEGTAVGIIEAKPAGTTLSGVEEQTLKYANGIPDHVPHFQKPLPYVFESTGTETYFCDLRDPDSRSRRQFAFYKPDTFKEWLIKGETLRARLRLLPEIDSRNLWQAQSEAITNLEKSFAENRPRALIQMATGSGKTYMAVSFIYRLLKFAGAKRVLFLVDRSNLGRQARNEFQQFVTPDDGRKFSELYNVQHMTSNTLDPVSKVCITTIQRLFSMLKGDNEFDPENEEQSFFDLYSDQSSPKEVVYNPAFPIEAFDFIVADECHRSIYHLWRQVLEYFDAFIIGLTATPSKQTIGFFNQNLVMEYTHERAVADGVNVGYDVYRIKTEITDKGSKVEAGLYIDKRNKLNREIRWEQLDEDLEYDARKLDRAVVSPDQIRTIVRTFRDKLFTEIFPGRSEVPKTLIFAKDDSHAEDIVRIVREEFAKGNDFCKKITYRTTGEKPENLIAAFRNSYNPRIAVTVDMISTGTDIKPLECLLFMRDVKSRIYFEQMKGRGTRVIASTDLVAVTPDILQKSRFVIVDAVGVCENDKTDSRPLERKPYIPFDKLLQMVALGERNPDMLTSLAGRLARMDIEINDWEKQEIQAVLSSNPAISPGRLETLTNTLLDAVDPDKQIERAKNMFHTEQPDDEQINKAKANLVIQACKPYEFPEIRNLLIDIKKRNEQIIDTISKDTVLLAGFSDKAEERAREVVSTFKRFIEENKDELTALQIIYEKPYAKRQITYEEIKQLAEAIRKPPYQLTPDLVWQAYEKLEKSKVKGAGPQKLLTNIVSLLRFVSGSCDILEPFAESVERRFAAWLDFQKEAGIVFSPEQLDWLRMIKDHIASSLTIQIDDFELAPFYEKGGAVRATQIFGENLNQVLQEMNENLVA